MLSKTLAVPVGGRDCLEGGLSGWSSTEPGLLLLLSILKLYERGVTTEKNYTSYGVDVYSLKVNTGLLTNLRITMYTRRSRPRIKQAGGWRISLPKGGLHRINLNYFEGFLEEIMKFLSYLYMYVGQLGIKLPTPLGF
jgi:hypothetical protein